MSTASAPAPSLTKDDKFRLLAHTQKGKAYVIRLSSVMRVSLADRVTGPERFIRLIRERLTMQRRFQGFGL